MASLPRPHSPAASSSSHSAPVLPPLALAVSPVTGRRRVLPDSPGRGRSHSHHGFVHSHSPSHSVPPLGAGVRPRGCRLPGCANFAKIQGLCAAHYGDSEDAAATATTTTPTARLPSLRIDQHLPHTHALERPRLPALFYSTTASTTTTASQYHHSSPLYAPPDHHTSYQLPSLSLRRFSEPPPPLHALATPLPLPLPVPRVSPLHRLRAPSDDAFAQFRRAQPARTTPRHHRAWQASPTHSAQGTSPSSAVSPSAAKAPATPASATTTKGTCRRENCPNAARRKGLCMEHGGRHFCKMDGCHKCAHRGGYCIAHGGGRRCAVAQCAKSAQSGGVCYSHGGGKRCATEGCSHAARSGGFCIKHGKMAKAGATDSE